MRKTAWSARTSWDTVCKRAAGRRHYNSVRALRATMRRRQVLTLLAAGGWTYGSQAQIARQLGVSEATISRDLAVMLPLVEECSTCHQFIPRTWWREA